MTGITTALIVFVLIGVAIPALIKSKPQFYAAVAFIVLAMLIDPFSFHTFCAFLQAIFLVLAFVALTLCCGGLELGEFASHMVGAYEAMRYGESKPVIVPRTGEMPKEKPANIPPVESIFTPPPAEPPPSIPLEPGTPLQEPESGDSGVH